MLEYLRIRDLALIEDMALEFGPGMNVLTGETGAGKTFILKAINFLLGEKLGVELVRPGRGKAQVEALFARPEGDLILRRELMVDSGRSRFFLNGDLSSQEVARELRPSLILHAGQHGQQRLLQPSYQAALVDSFLPSPELAAEKNRLVQELKALDEERLTLRGKVDHLREHRDLLEMQQKEINKVAPEPGEEERLEKVRQAQRGLEYTRQRYEQGLLIMRGENGGGLLDLLGQLERVLELLVRHNEPEQSRVEQDGSGAEDLAASLEALINFREEAQELDRMFRRAPAPALPEGVPYYDPEELEARLFALAQLKRKLHRSLPEILDLKGEIEENLSFLDACGLDVKRLDRREAELASALYELLSRFNAQRQEAAISFCRALEQELGALGFSGQVRVEPEITPHSLWPAVADIPACVEDRVRLLWAPNPGQAPQALDRIASGGELSRFLLAVVSIQALNEEAALIFDEVDSGVGGITLNRVADRLEVLASHRQMLLITHWPQLAARAARHFRVTKDIIDNQTYTNCQSLDEAARVRELARMAGQE